jgi:hypothetical protein
MACDTDECQREPDVRLYIPLSVATGDPDDNFETDRCTICYTMATEAWGWPNEPQILERI